MPIWSIRPWSAAPPQPRSSQRRMSRRAIAMRRRQEQLNKAAVHCAVFAFLATFFALGYFSTLLAFTAMVLISSSSCGGQPQGQFLPTSLLTACVLSYLCSVSAFWTTVIIILTEVCDLVPIDDGNATDTVSDSAAASLGITNSTDSAAMGIADPKYKFFCEYRWWLLSFNMLSSLLWCMTGVILIFLLRLLPLPGEIDQMTSRIEELGAQDGDTVAETDVGEDDDWDDPDGDCIDDKNSDTRNNNHSPNNGVRSSDDAESVSRARP